MTWPAHPQRTYFNSLKDLIDDSGEYSVVLDVCTDQYGDKTVVIHLASGFTPPRMGERVKEMVTKHNLKDYFPDYDEKSGGWTYGGYQDIQWHDGSWVTALVLC